MNTASIIVADMLPSFFNGWGYYPFLIICISYVLLFFGALLNTTFNKKFWDVRECLLHFLPLQVLLVAIAITVNFQKLNSENRDATVLLCFYWLFFPFVLFFVNAIVVLCGYIVGLILRLCFHLFHSWGIDRIRLIMIKRK